MRTRIRKSVSLPQSPAPNTAVSRLDDALLSTTGEYNCIVVIHFKSKVDLHDRTRVFVWTWGWTLCFRLLCPWVDNRRRRHHRFYDSIVVLCHQTPWPKIWSSCKSVQKWGPTDQGHDSRENAMFLNLTKLISPDVISRNVAFQVLKDLINFQTYATISPY